jgi:hypothetical protein
MAALAQQENKGPAVADQVLDLPLGQIALGDRLRPIDPVWAAALGQIMSVEGQKDPIKVTRLPGRCDYVLVTGGHRLSGAQLQGWATIKAIVVSADASERRITEISENLWRKGLDPIDRATFLADLVAELKARAGVGDATAQSIAANARWSKVIAEAASDASDTMSGAYGWTAEVAAQIGLNERTVRRDLELHRGLKPDVVAGLRGHPVSRNAGQLRALARLSDADQRAVLKLLQDGAAKGVTDALGLLNQKPKASPAAKRLSAFIGNFERMEGPEKRAALRTLQSLKLPRGVRIVLDGDADA